MDVDGAEGGVGAGPGGKKREKLDIDNVFIDQLEKFVSTG